MRPILCLLLVLVGCTPFDRQAIMAERATHDWLAPEHRRYVLADPVMDEAAKATRLRGLDAWNSRITAQEEAAGLVAPGGQR